MSSPTETHVSATDTREASGQDRERLLDRVVPESLFTPVQAVGFWVAVTLPVLYIPLLFTGLGTTAETVAFLALVGLNVAGLVVGRGYNQ